MISIKTRNLYTIKFSIDGSQLKTFSYSLNISRDNCEMHINKNTLKIENACKQSSYSALVEIVKANQHISCLKSTNKLTSRLCILLCNCVNGYIGICVNVYICVNMYIYVYVCVNLHMCKRVNLQISNCVHVYCNVNVYCVCVVDYTSH